MEIDEKTKAALSTLKVKNHDLYRVLTRIGKQHYTGEISADENRDADQKRPPSKVPLGIIDNIEPNRATVESGIAAIVSKFALPDVYTVILSGAGCTSEVAAGYFLTIIDGDYISGHQIANWPPDSFDGSMVSDKLVTTAGVVIVDGVHGDFSDTERRRVMRIVSKRNALKLKTVITTHMTSAEFLGEFGEMLKKSNISGRIIPIVPVLDAPAVKNEWPI
jgi:hypothetical protein